MAKKDYHFLNGDVVITVETSTARKLRPVKLDDLGSPDMNPKTGFKPIRVVANIVLEDEHNPGVYLTDLGQPVEIKIRYTRADFAAAAALGKPLALGFWDGTQWVRFTAAKHNFNLVPASDPNQGGVGSVTISKWGDPAASWGV